jgi:hypothetical protein
MRAYLTTLLALVLLGLVATSARATNVPSADVVTTTFVTTGTSTGTATFVPPRNSVSNLRIRILAYSTDSLVWGSELDNLAVKNVAGSVASYTSVSLTLGNILGAGAGDSALSGASCTGSTATDAYILTCTGVSSKTITWSVTFTARELQP